MCILPLAAGQGIMAVGAEGHGTYKLDMSLQVTVDVARSRVPHQKRCPLYPYRDRHWPRLPNGRQS